MSNCTNCGYNVTHLSENRCPECGQPFDPHRLRTLELDAPIPIWDNPERNIYVRLVRTCLATWCHPGGFAGTFPEQFSLRSARGFRSRALFIALVLVIGTDACSPSHIDELEPWTFAVNQLVWVAALLVGISACEGFLALVFASALKASGARKPLEGLGSVVHWRGLIGFFRSFVILSALVYVVGGLLVPIQGPFLMAGWLAVGFLWWAALYAVISTRRTTGNRELLAFISVPVLTVLSIMIGMAAGFVVRIALAPP